MHQKGSVSRIQVRTTIPLNPGLLATIVLEKASIAGGGASFSVRKTGGEEGTPRRHRRYQPKARVRTPTLQAPQALQMQPQGQAIYMANLFPTTAEGVQKSRS